LASSTNFDFTKARGDGFDVIFTKDDETTLLDFERERYATTTGNAEFWVEIPSVSSSTAATTTFYMYYGNSGASDISSSTAPWDTNYKAVYHLKDLTTSTVADSTGVSNGTKKAANEPVEANGKIAKAQSFDGSDDKIDASGFSIGKTYSLEFWFNVTDTGVRWVFSGNGESLYPDIYTYNGSVYFGTKDDDPRVSVSGLSTSTWYHIVGTVEADGRNKHLYVNGGTPTNHTHTSDAASYTTIRLGQRQNNTYTFLGLIDEVRVSNIERSAAWIKASYNSGNNSLLSYGAEEVPSVRRIIIIE